MPETKQPLLIPLFLPLLLGLTVSAAAGPSGRIHYSDAAALLLFKSKADLRGNLPFSSNGSYCKWVGVACLQGRVVRLVIEGFDLAGGVVPPRSIGRLDQLRVLSLQNNSLSGPIPDLSGLTNLKTLFLDRNSFSGPFPPSIFSLHRIRTVDLSHNNLTGPLPQSLANLDRLNYLGLDTNRFNGTVPPLNQSSLQTFNVSDNDLAGAIPMTSVLSHFGPASYLPNPGLCGEIVHKECRPGPPFFGSSAPVWVAPPPPGAISLGQSAELHGVNLTGPHRRDDSKRTPLIVGFSCGVLVLVASILCFALVLRSQRRGSHERISGNETADYVAAVAQEAAMVRVEQEAELEAKVKRVQEGMMQMQVGPGVAAAARSGSLVFCAGEAQVYSVEQLMRASAELLGRGTVGATYKAVLDTRVIVCVKRLDSVKMAGASREAFEGHMEAVGGLRHPNLVPLRAYLQAKEERLLVYDYQPNGSLYSLIHGSKSMRAKPLHWTSCLKIAEDVAQGLSYIHQAWRLVHGNLKSSNVLLGTDFEACVSDYCLAALLLPDPPPSDHDSDPNLLAYKAPEARHSTRSQPTPKSDVYAFGTLLLELLTSKPPFQHLNVEGATVDEVMGWVRSTREDDGVGGDDRLGMLLEVALACRMRSPEQRPTMWQVLKMLQEIREGVMDDDQELDLNDHNGPMS